MTCSPRDIIKPPTMQEKVWFKDGDTSDIISVILRMDRISDQMINKGAAQCLRGKNDTETLRNIWRFVKYNITYKPDSPGQEIIKSPAALYRIGKGDCKSFTIAVVALMRALGFRGIRYRFASYDGGAFTHVYALCKVNGRDVVVDSVNTGFNLEAVYIKKRDYPAHTAGISGIQTASAGVPIWATALLAILAIKALQQ